MDFGQELGWWSCYNGIKDLFTIKMNPNQYSVL